MPEIDGGQGKDEQLVAFDAVAQEPHPRLVVADALHDAAHLAGHDPGEQDVPQRQRQGRGPERTPD